MPTRQIAKSIHKTTRTQNVNAHEYTRKMGFTYT